jgi:hypothetical protein
LQTHAAQGTARGIGLLIPSKVEHRRSLVIGQTPL